MAVRANPNLVNELERFGVVDASKCYQCGNCSAVCKLSGEESVFPRKSMHYLQTGMDKPLRGSLNPWLCYYCGDCSDRCPRDANPGESMMGMRRWLTAQYDVTGLAKLLYTSLAAQILVPLFLALASLAGFLWLGYHVGGGDIAIYDGPRAFLPVHDIHLFDETMGMFLIFFLLINCSRMWYFTMCGKDKPRATLGMYLRHLVLLPFHFFTQKRWSGCDDKKPWKLHVWFLCSYVTMEILLVFFLKLMQGGPAVDWRVHFFGYIASVGLITTIFLAFYGRVKKDEGYHKHSHTSDWAFLVLLFYVVLTGVAQSVLHHTGFPEAANIAYLIHLMGVLPLLGTVVAFGKWSHMAYRPLSIYFARVQQAALAAQDEKAVAIGQAVESHQVA